MSTVKVGAQIAGVQIDELVARTATSQVYRGTDLTTGAATALKVLANPDDSAQRRLRREAALLQKVDHPSIVPFHSLHSHGDDLILVTKWVDGSSLRDRSRVGDTGSAEAAGASLELLKNLAAPLDYLHDRGIVHRDISPGNIIVSVDETPVLVDLGIGHTIGTATLTNHDLMAGTPRYLAPEIIRGESASGRADQYSLAVVLYEQIAGRSPFPASDEIATALHHQLHTEPEPLIEVVPLVTTAFSAAIMRALAKDPVHRFASVVDFARAAEGASIGGASSKRSRTQADPSRFPLSRSAVVLAAIALACIVLAAVLFWPGGASSERAMATELDPDWPVGAAATLGCNQLVGRAFENATLPVDYFGEPPGRERVVVSGGYGDTWALEVGRVDAFGQYGEIIPVITGEQYLFRGWFNPVGEVADAELGISLLDANLQGMDVSSASSISLDTAGFAQVTIEDVPDGAVFAVPYLFKDSSPGVLIADELVFGANAACTDEIAAMVGGS